MGNGNSVVTAALLLCVSITQGRALKGPVRRFRNHTRLRNGSEATPPTLRRELAGFVNWERCSVNACVLLLVVPRPGPSGTLLVRKGRSLAAMSCRRWELTDLNSGGFCVKIQ